MEAARLRVPRPLLVRPPAPLMIPAMLTALPLVSISPVLVRVTRRVEGDAMVPPASSVPPVKIRVLLALVPSPKASVELALKVPPPIVVAPV